VEAVKRDGKYRNFLGMTATVLGPGGTSEEVRLVPSGAGEYKAEFDARKEGNYVVTVNYTGEGEESGWSMSGMSVSDSPEFRDLQSNDVRIREIAERTGGRVIEPFEAEKADFYTRDKLFVDSWPRDVRHILIPLLLALILVDVAVRRIAWEWAMVRRGWAAVADYVRLWTLSKPAGQTSGETLDALKRVRGEVAETKFKTEAGAGGGGAAPAPNARAKFSAGAGVQGDITQVVGGATDKPLPAAPKKDPKGGEPGGHTGSLLEAKRRAQRKIREQEQGEQ